MTFLQLSATRIVNVEMIADARYDGPDGPDGPVLDCWMVGSGKTYEKFTGDEAALLWDYLQSVAIKKVESGFESGSFDQRKGGGDE